jgi:predicted nucleic acid-binding protein
MRKLIDSWAIMEWLQGQPAADAVQALLEEAERGDADLCMSMINVGEVYYLVHKRLGPERS